MTSNLRWVDGKSRETACRVGKDRYGSEVVVLLKAAVSPLPCAAVSAEAVRGRFWALETNAGVVCGQEGFAVGRVVKWTGGS